MAIPQTLSLTDSRKAYYESQLTLPNSGLSVSDLYSRWLVFKGATAGKSIADQERQYYSGSGSVQDQKFAIFGVNGELAWLRAQA
jgi:hypothetical protein